jgi:hypothetical protein
MLLTFGKFKGQELSNTPTWYQNWLKNQAWFNAPKPLYKSLSSWDGHSKNGQAIYDEIFEQEKAQALKQDCSQGICTCCQDSMYYGI